MKLNEEFEQYVTKMIRYNYSYRKTWALLQENACRRSIYQNGSIGGVTCGEYETNTARDLEHLYTDEFEKLMKERKQANE